METLNSIEQKGEFHELIDKIDKTNVTVYEKLNASNDKAAKQEFLDNPSLIHPNNEYGNLDSEEIKENINTLRNVTDELNNSWLSEKRKAFITLIADDSKKKNEFLAANLAYNEASTPAEKAEATAWHHETNANLYGMPDEDTFYTLLEEKISNIDVNNLTEENREVYSRLIDNIGPIKHPERDRFIPKQETINRFSELIKDYYSNFLSHIPENQETFSSSEAVNIINDILENEFDGEVNYKAVIDKKAANASASRGVIKFPEDKVYSKERLSALVLHELGTHAMRSIPYQEQDIKAFTTGLPNNETWDEGIAGCIEQALKGKYEDFGVDHYINIGLATFKNKNFREIYNIQKDLKSLTNTDDTNVLRDVQRCFRGTGELPNNKDLAYYNGNVRAWQYIENHLDDPELFDNLFLVGKADITNPEHEALSYEMRTKGTI